MKTRNFVRLLVIFTTMAVLMVALGSVGAVTDGELDNGRHPHVGIMVAFDNTGGWRCSGTLLSPTVFLTAGHCTDGAVGKVQLWFSDTVEGNPNYPYTGDVTGTAYTHPLYPTAPFFVNDVGVVVLDTPVYLDTYGVLPAENQLDALKTQRGQQEVWFTAVGYGLQQINPVFIEAERTRMLARPHLIQINVPGFTGDFSLLLSNNHSTGGTCFGDSGGPNFLNDTNIVAGVTSFGINGNCAGTGGVFRMDRANALNFVLPFLD